MQLTKPQLSAIQLILDCISELKLDYFLVGATARNLLFQHYGLEGLRRTYDWDFAVKVNSWEEYKNLVELLAGRGFQKTNAIHTLHWEQLVVDIVPFGKIEDASGNIQFPEPDAGTMSMAGFEDFSRCCEEIKVQGVMLRVGAFTALLGSKILAWNDRKFLDDANDILALIKCYEEFSENFYAEVGEDDFPLSDRYDHELARYYLSGRALARSLSEKSRTYCLEIVENWVESDPSEIVAQLTRNSIDYEVDYEQLLRRFEFFASGLRL